MNQPDAISGAIEVPPTKRVHRRQVGTITLLLVCAGCLWFLMPNPTPAPAVTILPSDYSIPPPPLPVPDRWIPMKWDWLWRLRSAILPANPTIDIETRLIRLSNSDKPLLTEVLEGRAPFTNSNGVRAWIFSEQQLDAFGRRLEERHGYFVGTGRTTTGPGVLSNQSMTTSVPIDGTQVPVGDSLTYAVLRQGRSVELTGSFISWEGVTNRLSHFPEQKEVISLRTNLTLAAKLLIPPGQGVFLLDTNRFNARSSGVGVFISAKLR